RRHTRFSRDWSSDVCSSDLQALANLRHLVLRTERGEVDLFDEQVSDATLAVDLQYQVHDALAADPCHGCRVARWIEAIARDVVEIGRASCREGGWVGTVDTG